MKLLCVLLPALLCMISSSLGHYHKHKHDECIRLDASINFQGVIYLFSGKHFIQLDDQNRELRVKNIVDEWGYLENIDAALSYEDTAYLFQGSYYYYFSYPFGMVGPLSNYRWGPEIGKRVDAAVSGGVNGSMFIKDCIVYDYIDGELQIVRDLNDDNIPCDIDAALSLDLDDEEKVALFKYDQVWYISFNGSVNGSVSGPFDANDEFHLSSKFCSEIDYNYNKDGEMDLKTSENSYEKSSESNEDEDDDDDDDDEDQAAIQKMWKNKFSKYWKPSKSGSSSSSSSSSNSGEVGLKKRHYFENSKISDMVEMKKMGLHFMINSKKARLAAIDHVDDKQGIKQMIEQGKERIAQVIQHAGQRLKQSGLKGHDLDHKLKEESDRLSKIINDDERVIDEILTRLEAKQHHKDSVWDN